jgi:alkaline phosphatase D
VVLTGDIHSSWAMDIPAERFAGYRSVGVEFVCPSITSDGFYELVSASAKGAPTPVPAPALVQQTRGLTTAVSAANPWVRYLDGVGHGFVVLDVTAKRVQADYYLTPVPTVALPDPRVDPGVEPVYGTSWQTLRTSRRVVAAAGPVGRRHDEPRERKH